MKHRATTLIAPGSVHEDDDAALNQLGYKQELSRSMGKFTAFCVTFSIISATTAVFTNFGYGLSTGGPAFVWTYPIAMVVIAFWIFIMADMTTKLPIAGYAYQWSSRINGRGLGWFTGWIAIIGWIAGMTGVTFALAGYFGSLVGIRMTTGRQELITIGIMILVMVINIVGVKLASRINNVGAMTEIVSTVVLTVVIAVVALFIKKSPNPGSFLFQRGHAASPFIWAWVTSSLVGLWGLLGAESAADVAEETKDTRHVIPRVMFLGFGVACIIEFAMSLAFTYATPNLVATAGSATPLTYITQHYLGTAVTKVFLATVVIAMFACSLANMLATTRLTFSMARDNMLPFSGFFRHVSKRFRSPSGSILVVGTLSCLFVLSAKAMGYIVGLSALGFYLVFLLMTIGLIQAYRAKRLPSPRGGFDLGRWRGFVYYVGGVLFLLTVLMLALTPANRINGRNMLIAVALGGLWYVLRLRGKIARGEAGAPQMILETQGRPHVEPKIGMPVPPVEEVRIP